jgi:hypothetical protein
MNKFLDWIKGSVLAIVVICYCIFASFMCLFPNNKDE